jgi:hypothetical protein
MVATEAASCSRQAECDGDREDDERSQFGKQGDDHALERPRHDVTDIEQDADAHEHQAGDQAVAEGQRVDRLQPVDLHDVDQIIDGSDINGSTNSVPILPLRGTSRRR